MKDARPSASEHGRVDVHIIRGKTARTSVAIGSSL